MQTRECGLCGNDIPIEPGEGEIPVFKNHSRGFKQGKCDFSGEPVDAELQDIFDPEDFQEDEEPHVREGHGKPARTRE